MQALKKLVAQYNQGKFLEAKRTGLKIIKKDKNNFDALQIIALSEKALGSYLSAEHFFKRCLIINKTDSRAFANFADLLVLMDRKSEAARLYKSSLSLNGQDTLVLFNYANLLYGFESFEQAQVVIENALSIKPTYAKAYLLLGNIQNSLGNKQEALNAFDKAYDYGVAQNDVLLHKMALYRSNNCSEKVVDLLDIKEQDISNPELLFQKACAYYDLGHKEQCESVLKRALSLNPNMIEAHKALNNMYWEMDELDKFLTSFTEFPQQPLSYELLLAYVSLLILSGRNSLAHEVIDDALKKFGSVPHLLQFKAVLFSKNMDQNNAEKYFRKALEKSPHSIRLLIDCAGICIRKENYKQADKFLKKAGVINPIDQEIWAYKGLSWRLQGDERYLWLNNYDVLIKEYELEAPEAYDDLEHFLTELSEISKASHISGRQPLDQSVIGGTQTIGKFLARRDKVIQAYKNVLEKNINDYLTNLPIDVNHPFLSRNTKNYAHNGSWSVSLKKGGYHSNHVHPQGWLSNCTYVSIPREVHESDLTRSGWIKFGETSLGLQERESIGRLICPKPGKHVLFPSFLWHGTVPFDSDEYRVTIPSDIRPIIY